MYSDTMSLFMILISSCLLSDQIVRCNPKETTATPTMDLIPAAGILGDLVEYYQQLILFLKELKCGYKMSEEGDACLRDAEKNWKDEGDSKKQKCCSNLDTMNCLKEYAKEKCDEDVYKSVKDKAKKLSDELVEEKDCSAYGHRWYDLKSWKCRIPWFFISVILFITLLVIVLSIVLCYFCCKK